MPTKIVTDLPQAKRKLIQHVVTNAWVTVAEPPYFSVPVEDPAVAVADPADANRELRPGELFIATALQIANTSGSAATLDMQIVGEGGVTTTLAPTLTVPANEVLSLLPGLSLFKRDLANPTDTADILRVKSGTTGALTLTATLVEREALDHAPDTEV